MTTFAPVDLVDTIPNVTPRYKGVLYKPFADTTSTFGSDVVNGASFPIAYPAGTDQAYWLALPGTDIEHRITVGISGYYASRSQMSVSFDASVITITNNSGATWATGQTYYVALDRSSEIGAIPSTYASPATLPLLRLDTGSSGINPGSGLFPQDDFEVPGSSTLSRGGTPNAGAVQAVA